MSRPTPVPEADPPRGAIVKDPEIAAIDAITKKMLALDLDAQQRVLNWLVARFSRGPTVMAGRSNIDEWIKHAREAGKKDSPET